jgi:phosphate transport system permease protein
MYFFLITVIASYLAFYFVKKRLVALKNANDSISSLPLYYGICASAWVFITNLIIFFFMLASNNLEQLSYGVFTLCVSGTVIFIGTKKLNGTFKARQHFEKIMKILLIAASSVSIIITFLIVASILFESLQFFRQVSLFDFLFGTDWHPQVAMRSDQGGSSGSFGAIPVFVGTLLITLIAMVVAIPLGILSAVYLTEYSSTKVRNRIKPLIEILAGIPTVVYGYFAAFTIAPFVKDIGVSLGLDVASESALAAGLVMGIMIIPFILSLSDDVMNAVPNSLRDASYALGSTTAETVSKVVIPAALPGIIGAILLAISRAIGETMIVTMAAGLNANLTMNPFASVTTATAQMMSLLVGDQEFDNIKTLSAFALGITLFVITLCLNIVALFIVKKYREKYE